MWRLAHSCSGGGAFAPLGSHLLQQLCGFSSVARAAQFASPKTQAQQIVIHEEAQQTHIPIVHKAREDAYKACLIDAAGTLVGRQDMGSGQDFRDGHYERCVDGGTLASRYVPCHLLAVSGVGHTMVQHGRDSATSV